MIEKFFNLLERLVVAVERIASSPVTGLPPVSEAPAPAEEKTKRTRKPKEEQQSEKQDFLNSPLGSVPAPTVATSAFDAFSEPAPAAPPTQEATAPAGIAANEVQRKNVSACLITIAKNPEIGPQKAFEILTRYNAQEVKDLKEADYRNVVLDAAKLLNIEPRAALALDPTKG